MPLAYEPAAALADRFLKTHVVQRIWDRDVSVWGAAPGSAAAHSIASRLGWLDVPQTMAAEVPRVAQLGHSARHELEAVYLLGMGGSSLCAEVLRAVLGVSDGFPELFVLDTTDEQTIRAAAARIDPDRTLFIVASKSGTTLEVTSLERFFWSRLSPVRGDTTGRQFIAITDPGTALQQLAESRRYRELFLNPPDIGGRFSALSLFGLVPAALIGASPADVLSGGSAMAAGCRQENHANAGLELGAFIGAAAANGRDKLTVVLPPTLASLGLWIEQLIAESTGKEGKGALPVVDEALGRPDKYGTDRAFVAIATERDEPDREALEAIAAAGHPVLRLSTRLDGIGAEFFRWEFATAVAGAALEINPFDEPNVAEAKDKTRALLATYAERGKLDEAGPVARAGRIAVYSSRFRGGTPAEVIRALIDSLRPNDYVAFLSYLPPSSDVVAVLADIRVAIRAKYRAATTFGIGPRYLHSTGQYHKGGPNTAVAVVITGDDPEETPIPDAGYSFSVLKLAQALGDTQTLEAHGRRVARIHVSGDPASAASVLTTLFSEALG